MERNAFAQNLVMEWLNKELEGRKKGKWNIFLDETLINHASRDCRKMPEIANFLIQWWHESKKSPRPLLTDFEAESIDAWLDASKVQPQASPKPALTQFPEKTALTVASNQETSKLKKSIAE